MTRFFNTTEPCNPEDHYMLPPLSRLPRDVRTFIERKQSFVLYAPRQTGKTTALSPAQRVVTVATA